ncbi:MAG: hypothetical protein EHM57_06055 [Actinobacteria bacterium]|nr:MAG: hypothetical protein EHM57_06055 [Actinomycetota bacterium]
MSEGGLDELLRSPFDGDDEGGGGGGAPWLAPVIGIAAGIAVFAALVSTVGAGSGSAQAVTTTTAGEAGVVELADPFPDGYVPVAGDLAVRAFPPVEDGDRLLVPIAVAVRRGVEPDEAAALLGGRWELATASGSVPSEGVVTHGLFPGALSIVFPGDAVPGDEIRLVEMWRADDAEMETTVEFPGTPYDLPEPIAHDLGNGVTLTIERLQLRNLLAEAQWSVTGTDLATVSLGLDLLVDDGALLESYVGGFPDETLRSSGTIQFVWPVGNRVGPDAASQLRIRAQASIGDRVPADVVVPLPSG